MKPNQASLTAEGIALLRAVEPEKSAEEQIRYDSLAKYQSEALEIQGVRVIHVDWSPPAGGDQEMMSLLDRLL